MKRLVLALVLLLGACATPPPSRLALPAPPPKGEPTGLVGLSGRELQARLGTAAFTRRENGSELWRYDGKDCRAFFFLYTEGGTARVRHVETVPHGDTAADTDCLNALRAKRSSPVS
jgi:hypothetical protein